MKTISVLIYGKVCVGIGMPVVNEKMNEAGTGVWKIQHTDYFISIVVVFLCR